MYFSGGHGYMNRHNIYLQNVLKPFIHSSKIDDIEMNDDLNNGDVNRGIGLIDNHICS